VKALVSIVIDNYNYARYLGAAIDSALAQTWRPLEVIVVDDGSTDDSWAVASRYGERIRAIRQANGGQGAAYNTGFAASRGEWVMFLDSDDLLDANAIARLMALADDDVAKVHGPLERVGPDGEPIGGVVPFVAHEGDVTPIARHFRQYGSPPGSGNLFRRSAIAPYFPMEAEAWRRSADTIPILLAAFHGRVAGLESPMGSYRLHLSKARGPGLLGNIDRSLAGALLQADRRRRLAQEWGSRCTGLVWPEGWTALPWDWRLRALSFRLAREEHPYPGDSTVSISVGLADALARWPGYRLRDRLLQRAWMALVLHAPRAVVARLAPAHVSGGLRQRLRGKAA
jgi:glycosyltransferase involved in cell wall biosynthesis